MCYNLITISALVIKLLQGPFGAQVEAKMKNRTKKSDLFNDFSNLMNGAQDWIPKAEFSEIFGEIFKLARFLGNLMKTRR